MDTICTTIARTCACLGAVAVLFTACAADAITLDDPDNFEVVQTWVGADLGVPGNLGAMMFTDDGESLYIVGNCEAWDSALYLLDVERDPTTGQVTDLVGPATLVFEGDPSLAGLDTGLEWGPDDTLFYTYWSAHYLGQRPGGFAGAETVYDMTPTGVPSSVAGLDFAPRREDPATGFGQLQVSSWLGNGIYDIPLTPLGGGLFEPGTAELFVALPQQGTGAIQYIPQGLFTGNLMYVNWDYGEVRMLVIDPESGLPVDADTGDPTFGTQNPEDIRFAYDMGVGPWGLEFDPLSLDFFVSTWNGEPYNAIVQFTGPGFANQAPVALDQELATAAGAALDITLTGVDADLDELTFAVDDDPTHGALTGTPPDLTYTPDDGFEGADAFTFTADDGELTSAPATISIDVGAGAVGDDDDSADPDDGADCSCDEGAAPAAAPGALVAALLIVGWIRRVGRAL